MAGEGAIAKKQETNPGHARIVVGLPNLQDQLRLVDRLARSTSEPEQQHWEDLGELLADLYTQLQRQEQVTVYRFGQRGKAKVREEGESRRR